MAAMVATPFRSTARIADALKDIEKLESDLSPTPTLGATRDKRTRQYLVYEVLGSDDRPTPVTQHHSTQHRIAYP
jgi:hypothetical protein